MPSAMFTTCCLISPGSYLPREGGLANILRVVEGGLANILRVVEDELVNIPQVVKSPQYLLFCCLSTFMTSTSGNSLLQKRPRHVWLCAQRVEYTKQTLFGTCSPALVVC